MAITVSFTPSSVTLSTTGGSSTFTLTDNSTYTSPARNAVGVFLTVFKTDYSGLMSPLTATANDGDPATDSVWTVVFTSDGWHQGLYVAVPNYSGGTTYAKYDAAYDPTSHNVYVSAVAGNVGHALSNTTYWNVVSDPTTLAQNVGLSNESANITAATLNFVEYPYLKQGFGYQTGIAFLEESTDAKRTKDVRKYHLLELAVNCINESDIAGDYQTAEIVARRASELL